MLRLVLAIAGLAAVTALAASEPTTPADFDRAFAALLNSKGQTNDSARLRSLFALSWRHQMIENPEAATYVGFPGQNGRWADLSRAAIERRKREVQRPLDVLATINRAALSPDEHLYRDLFERLSGWRRKGADFRRSCSR